MFVLSVESMACAGDDCESDTRQNKSTKEQHNPFCGPRHVCCYQTVHIKAGVLVKLITLFLQGVRLVDDRSQLEQQLVAVAQQHQLLEAEKVAMEERLNKEIAELKEEVLYRISYIIYITVCVSCL